MSKILYFIKQFDKNIENKVMKLLQKLFRNDYFYIL